MPVKFVTAEEFAKLTGGYRGSVYIGPAPVRRPKPEKSQEVFLCPLLRVVEQREIRRSTLRPLRQDVGEQEAVKALTFRPTPLIVQRRQQQLQLRTRRYLNINANSMPAFFQIMSALPPKADMCGATTNVR